ncbi:MAG: hypothetical protein EOP54_27980 [Sphingobacteriales bacterium]|nr:MAG: hypothetical protein EOP54_27980 [Sphingobacteriales bacterium]
MLKRGIAVFLLLAMIGANCSRFFVYAGFEVNRSFIVKELCENRDKPEMKCEGKCFLKKRLAAAEEKEKKQEQEARSKAAVDVFVINEPLVLAFQAAQPAKQRPSPIFFLLSEFTNDILHPPSQGAFLI